MSKTYTGKPWPLGSTITPRGVNFSVAAPNASHIELLIFENSSDTSPSQTFKLTRENQSGDYWHIEVQGKGAGCCYSYRVFGKGTSKKYEFHPNKVLLDPCAREISGWQNYQRKDAIGDEQNIKTCLKGVVCERDTFNFIEHPRPRHQWSKSVIYELHLGGFTRGDSVNVDSLKQGTFLGLKTKIPYLVELGVTTIELLPVFSFDPSDSPYGLENYWGYSPINWFTPHHDYILKKNSLSARDQVRDLIAACHDQRIEVILDVVYNHTTEGSKSGPILSWRGFGDSVYYHQNSKGEYLDVSGCGNSIAANKPLVRKLILESMRCWANELGVDGFRFDLGIALSRGEELKPLADPPLFEEIEADPQLSDLKIISEPWDCGGLYQLADFPARRIKTWNGHFRDDLRKFWKGDQNSVWKLKDRLQGSKELYKSKDNEIHSVNFITAHDGFTLNDLVSFSAKHNLANGEKNRDGDNHNNSYNYQIEGPTTDRKLIEIRRRQQRNLFASLILSPGVPMLLMGDEVSRSQGGNNNCWCQNNPLGWMIWDLQKCDLELLEFVKKLLLVRKSLPEFFTSGHLLEEDITDDSSQKNNVFWVQWHGVKRNKPDWGYWSHTISYSINKANKGAVMWMGLNAYSQSMYFELPDTESHWETIINTAKTSKTDLRSATKPLKSKDIELDSKSLVVLLSDEYAQKVGTESKK